MESGSAPGTGKKEAAAPAAGGSPRDSHGYQRLLGKITRYISRTADPNEALEGIVRRIATGTDCEVCSLYSYDPVSRNIRLAATEGLPARSIGNVSMSPGEGLVGTIVETGEVIRTTDAPTHESFKFFPELGEETVHSFLGVPVGEGEGLQGVLVLQSRRRRQFSDEEVGLLKALALHVRGVMLHAHLSDRLQREEAERDRFRREMGDVIARLERSRDDGAFDDVTLDDFGLGARMVHLAGDGASPGFGIGRAHPIEPPVDVDEVEIHQGNGEEVERSRFDAALTAAIEATQDARRRMRDLVPEVGGDLYEALGMIIEDRAFAARVLEEISTGLSAESSVKVAVHEFVRRFEAMEHDYLRERAIDVRDAGQRILAHLLGVDSNRHHLVDDAVLVSDELTLSDLAAVDHDKLRGIVTAVGGATSHAVILAKSLGVPAVVGCETILDTCDEKDTVIVDGNTGTVYVRPLTEQLDEYRRMGNDYREFRRRLDEMRDLPAVTLDDRRIHLMANAGLMGEIVFAERNGAEGIGLYRTEFPFLTYRDFPSENEQVGLYRKVFDRVGDKPVTVRTLDIGADKYPAYAARLPERNPVLGWRAIRVSLSNERIFGEQIRAVLRASTERPVRILFPMITSVEEIRRAREVYCECLSDLAEQGVQPHSVELGAMIEVPAAVLQIEQIVREVDFLSIGTNDLIQYTLAVDRDNTRVADMYQPLHPAVLHSISRVVRAGRDADRPVSMCGEMAGDPMITPILVGLGLTELSMGPLSIAPVKKVIRALRHDECMEIADEILRYETVQEIRGAMFEHMRRLGLIDLVESLR